MWVVSLPRLALLSITYLTSLRPDNIRINRALYKSHISLQYPDLNGYATHRKPSSCRGGGGATVPRDQRELVSVSNLGKV